LKQLLPTVNAGGIPQAMPPVLNRACVTNMEPMQGMNPHDKWHIRVASYANQQSFTGRLKNEMKASARKLWKLLIGHGGS